nr:MAG TPA_asm: hypothetical protein [Caudoviricetes sp.]
MKPWAYSTDKRAVAVSRALSRRSAYRRQTNAVIRLHILIPILRFRHRTTGFIGRSERDCR